MANRKLPRPSVLVLVLVDDGLISWSFHAPISDQYLSSLFLDEFVVGASITCCGNEFQLLQTRTLKNIFRVVLAHLGTKTFIECPLRLYASGAIWNNWLFTRSFPVE